MSRMEGTDATDPVLVADDNEGFGVTLAGFVAVHQDMLGVGRASDGREAVSMTESLTPDVVLMDLFMRGWRV